MATAFCAIALSGSLSGCGYLYDPHGFSNAVTPWQNDEQSEAAMLAYSKGEFDQAEKLAGQAVRRNPRDPYALLVLALIYQNTGRAELAREYYEALISMHPQSTVTLGGGPGLQRRTIEEIAQANLAAMGPVPAYGTYAAIPGTPLGSYSTAVQAQPVAVDSQDADSAVITRFKTLRRLMDEGLITQDEYTQRRAANLGALLPYSALKPGAYGLGLAAPSPDQIVNRLKAIGANFEEKSITELEQGTERNLILEALLPLKPERMADRPAPASDEMRYAAVNGRVQRLLDNKVITSAEAARERKVVQGQITEALAQREAAAQMSAGTPMPPPSASGPGVALGLYGTQMRAEIAWEGLQRRFPQELGNLQSSIHKVTHRRRGSSYSLSAGPVAGRKAAQELCRTLKRAGETCSPTVIK